jgi:hypothetical protein
MRLNRGTLLLILGAVAVIVAAFILTSQQTSAPGGEPTATAAAAGAGPIFPAIADSVNQGTLVRFEVVNNTDSTRMAMTKDTTTNLWTVSEAPIPQALDTDQVRAVGTMSNLASLTALDRFPATNLVDFGLDAPDYVLSLTDAAGAVYRVQIGNRASANPRYYALVGDDTSTVYLLPADIVDGLTGQILNPAYVPSPTPSPSPTRTPNPFSEVEQTATAQVEQQNLFATQTAIFALPEATAEATGETTAEANVVPATATVVLPSLTPAAVEATAEATMEMEMTAEVTAEPTTVPTVRPTNTPRPTNTTVPTVRPTNTTVPTVRPTNTPRPTNTTVPTVRPTNTPRASATP